MRKSTSPLRSLDLFSGIGGLTLALRGVAEPIAYCDIDPHAQAVLQRQMRAGNLPVAPICPDVRTLTRRWLADAVDGGGPARGAPEAIVAGFPCTGFSTVGRRDGYANEQSGLFVEILRLLDQHASIRHLFLENVAAFLNEGMEVAVRELHRKRGFELRWCIVEARDVGAPHRRRRWFCYGCKGGPPPSLSTPIPMTLGGHVPYARRWRREQRRTLCADGSEARARAALLGNAVVPDCARAAFVHLLTEAIRGRMPPDAARGGGGRPAEPALRASSALRWPPDGAVVDGVVRVMPPMPALTPREPMGLVLDSSHYRPPRGFERRNRLPILARKPIDYWATPRCGAVTASQTLTHRTSTDLATQVRYEAGTLDSERGCAVNPRFVEWLMGYPVDWTKLVG